MVGWWKRERRGEGSRGVGEQGRGEEEKVGEEGGEHKKGQPT